MKGRGPRAALALLALLGPAVLLPGAGAGPAPGPAAPPRLLILALDAVPYSLVAELTDPARGDEALFRGFPGPVPLISTFPSNTNIAFTGILEPLGVEPALGYEVRFFDRAANAIRGGGPVSYHRFEFPWRERFAWRTDSLWRRFWGKIRPVRSSLTGVGEVMEAFAASPDEVFLAYISETDAAAHLKSPEALAAVLRELDGALAAARRAHPERPFATVLLSDHGIAGGPAPLVNVRKAVREQIRSRGFRLAEHLRRPREVVLVDLGMVSNFVLYTRPGEELEVAAAAAAAPGVDLCVFPEEGGFGLESARGRARVGRRSVAGEERWAYRPLDGDPLGYLPAVEGLRRRLGSAGEEWFADHLWFAATAAGEYPDGLYRLARAFELVANRASVLCSTAPGYMYGARRTQVAARLSVGRLRWTHGALFREASLGFLLSDAPGWQPPPAERFDRALAPFARRVEVALGGARSAGERLARVFPIRPADLAGGAD